MIEYINSIKRSGKQLTLLSLILLSGGGIAQAQDTAPDTVYVSFPSPLKINLVYGEKVQSVADWLEKQDVKLSCSWHPALGASAVMQPGQLTFKDGKGFADILKFSVETPVVGGENQNYLFNAAEDGKLPDVFETSNGQSELITTPIVYFVSKADGAIVENPLSITQKPLYVTLKPITRVYGEELPDLSKLAVEAYLFDGFIEGEESSIFDGTTNVLPTFKHAGNFSKNVDTYNLFSDQPGKAANYALRVVDIDQMSESPGDWTIPISWVAPQLTITKADLALGMKAYSRLYDDPNPEYYLPIDSLLVKEDTPLAYEEKLNDLLTATPGSIWNFNIGTPVKDQWHRQASDVGDYKYGMTKDAFEAIQAKLSNYKLAPVDSAVFTVLQDTITITMKAHDIHNKIYGEENPVAEFYLTKRVNRGHHGYSPTGKADNLKEKAIVDYIGGIASQGFTTEPTFAFKDYEGEDVTIETPATLKKKDSDIDSLYVVKVSNTPASLNYHFTYVDGSLRVDQRNLTFNKVIVNREYGSANSDTTWYFEPTNAETKTGLASFHNDKYKVTTNPDFIEKRPLVVIDEAAADLSTNAGEWKGRENIEIINYVADPYYFAIDRNYRFDLGIIMPTDESKFQKDSVALDIKKAPLVITLDTIFGSYGENIPLFNDKDWQYKHPEFISYEGFKLDEWAANLDLKDDWDNQYHQPGDPEGNRIKTLEIKDYTPGEVLPIGSYELIGWDLDRYKVNTNYDITIKGKPVYHINAVKDYAVIWNKPSTTTLVTGQLIGLNAKLVDRHGNLLPYTVNYKSEDDQKLKVHTVNNVWYVEALAITQTPVKVIAYFEDPNHLYTEKAYSFEVVRRENESDFNIIIEESSYTYDGTPKPFLATIKDPLNVETYDPIYEYNGSETVPTEAGTYNVTIYVEKKNTGTHLKVMEEKLVINKRKVQVQADDTTVVYGQALPEKYTYTVLPTTDEYGFIGSDEFTLSGKPGVTVVGDITGAGEYDLMIVNGNPGDNYEMVSLPGKLTVAKAPLTIAADTLTAVYGDEIPVPTKTITGLVNGDKEEDLRFIYTAKYDSEKKPEDAGTYPIVIDCDASNEANYDVKLIPALLTITKADPELSLYAPTTTLAGGDTIEVEVSTFSPAGVTYTMQYDTVATVTKVSDELAKIGGKHQGVTKLYVTVAEDKNYLAASDSLTFNVTTTVANENIALQNVGLYPTLVESKATITSDSPVGMIRVFNAGGSLVKQIVRPDQTIDLSSLVAGYHLVQIILESGDTKTVRIVKK